MAQCTPVPEQLLGANVTGDHAGLVRPRPHGFNRNEPVGAHRVALAGTPLRPRTEHHETNVARKTTSLPRADHSEPTPAAATVERPPAPHTATQASAIDGYLVIDGRRWRATDPHIPPPLEATFTHALMDARRAVKAAKGKGAEAERAARRRVQDAKVALGERGPRWWQPMSDDEKKQRLAATIRVLVRTRGQGKSICPSEAARALGASNWRQLMPLAREVAFELQAAGEVTVTQKQRPVDATARGPLRIGVGAGLG